MKCVCRFNNDTKASRKCLSYTCDCNCVTSTSTVCNSDRTARRRQIGRQSFDTDKLSRTCVSLRVSRREACFVCNRRETPNIIKEINNPSVDSSSCSNMCITTTPRATRRNSFTRILTEVTTIRCRATEKLGVRWCMSSLLCISDNDRSILDEGITAAVCLCPVCLDVYLSPSSNTVKFSVISIRESIGICIAFV